MAQKVIINGVTYNGVSSIKIPLADNPETLAVFPDTSDATATKGNILNGQTAYVEGSLVTGDMPNNGAYKQTITAVAQVVTLPGRLSRRKRDGTTFCRGTGSIGAWEH